MLQLLYRTTQLKEYSTKNEKCVIIYSLSCHCIRFFLMLNIKQDILKNQTDVLTSIVGTESVEVNGDHQPFAY